MFVQKAAEELHFQQPISGCILNHPRQSSGPETPERSDGTHTCYCSELLSERAAAKQEEKKTNWTVFLFYLRAPQRDSRLAN